MAELEKLDAYLQNIESDDLRMLCQAIDGIEQACAQASEVIQMPQVFPIVTPKMIERGFDCSPEKARELWSAVMFIYRRLEGMDARRRKK